MSKIGWKTKNKKNLSGCRLKVIGGTPRKNPEPDNKKNDATLKNNYQCLIFDIEYKNNKAMWWCKKEIKNVIEKAVCCFSDMSAAKVSEIIKKEAEKNVKNRKGEDNLKTWLRIKKKATKRSIDVALLDLFAFEIHDKALVNVDFIIKKCKNVGFANLSEAQLQRQIKDKINSKKFKEDACILFVSFCSENEKVQSEVNLF
ncbi:MAG: hypothetical protein LBH37_04280 [Oscillospiraceae bacterium]|jgi:hypothetical protein|nr:hypothetical protein [Oscillospiraceae bacterium]